MRFCLSLYSLYQSDGIRKYVEASKSYFERRDFGIREFYPDIHKECPHCHAQGCAIWKGYYGRQLVCSTLDEETRIIIRKGLCKNNQVYFTFPPDFIIPYVKWSFPLLLQALHDLKVSWSPSNVLADLDIALSSLYWILQLILRSIRAIALDFPLPPLPSNSIHELKKIIFQDYRLILQRAFAFRCKGTLSSGPAPPRPLFYPGEEA